MIVSIVTYPVTQKKVVYHMRDGIITNLHKRTWFEQ